MSDSSQIILVDQIEPLIRTFRGQKVLLDSDLALLYGVPTKRLNEQVQRNRRRFPEDFMFQLTSAELEDWRSQNATASEDEPLMRSHSATGSKRNVRYRPYVFTEHGAIMAANVLNSPRAVEVGVYVVRAFVKLRELVATHKELARKLAELEQKVGTHDEAIRQLIEAIRQLMAPPPQTQRRRRIGFGREKEA